MLQKDGPNFKAVGFQIESIFVKHPVAGAVHGKGWAKAGRELKQRRRTWMQQGLCS